MYHSNLNSGWQDDCVYCLRHSCVLYVRLVMKFLFLIAGLAVLPVQAQITFFNDSLGMPLGTANQIGNTTFYSDAMGLPLGTAQTIGNTTFYSNSLGLPLGTANTPQPIPSYTPRHSSPPAPTFPTAPLFPTSPRGW
jgi:hypothetical protein